MSDVVGFVFIDLKFSGDFQKSIDVEVLYYIMLIVFVVCQLVFLFWESLNLCFFDFDCFQVVYIFIYFNVFIYFNFIFYFCIIGCVII